MDLCKLGFFQLRRRTGGANKKKQNNGNKYLSLLTSPLRNHVLPLRLEFCFRSHIWVVEHGSTTAMVIVGCGQRRKEKEKNKERKKDEGRAGERSEKIEIL